MFVGRELYPGKNIIRKYVLKMYRRLLGRPSHNIQAFAVCLETLNHRIYICKYYSIILSFNLTMVTKLTPSFLGKFKDCDGQEMREQEGRGRSLYRRLFQKL